jgi:hypothetical protein
MKHEGGQFSSLSGRSEGREWGDLMSSGAFLSWYLYNSEKGSI